SPEQAKGEKPSPASDVYSIGIVLFEMLTGHLPFTGGSQQELALAHVKEEPPLMSALNPDVPDQLVRIVRKAMDKNPGARYRDADQLLGLLVNFRDQMRLGNSQPQSRPMPPPGQSQPSVPSQGVAPVAPPPVSRPSPAPDRPP